MGDIHRIEGLGYAVSARLSDDVRRFVGWGTFDGVAKPLTTALLQLGAAVLTVQARHGDDPACRGALVTAMGRLRRMGEAHAPLTYGAADGPAALDFPDYLRRLCREVAEGLSDAPGRVEAEEEAVWGPDLVVPSSCRRWG